jgi:hypothetical protein
VNAVATGTTLLKVYVAHNGARFTNTSLTYPVLIAVVDHCCGVTILPVVVFRVLPLKLYGVVCNPIHASLAPVINNIPVSHSLPFAFANINVGGVPS